MRESNKKIVLLNLVAMSEFVFCSIIYCTLISYSALISVVQLIMS